MSSKDTNDDNLDSESSNEENGEDTDSDVNISEYSSDSNIDSSENGEDMNSDFDRSEYCSDSNIDKEDNGDDMNSDFDPSEYCSDSNIDNEENGNYRDSGFDRSEYSSDSNIDNKENCDASDSSSNEENGEDTDSDVNISEYSSDSNIDNEENCDASDTDNGCNKKSNYVGESDDSESVDKLHVNSVFDKKLDYVTIMKIDTNHSHLSDEKAVSITTRVDDLKIAERMIKKVVEGKRKNNENPAEPRGKKPKLDSNVADVHASTMAYPYVKELKTFGKKLPQYFLKLYIVQDEKVSSFSKQFAEFVTEDSREMICKKKEHGKSYILLFYRNVTNTSTKGKGPPTFRPEIFAVTTGAAWRFVSRCADEEFTNSVEKRTLRSSFQYVKCKLLGGLVSKEAKSARPGNEINFTVWDFLGKFVEKCVRHIRPNSSLYSRSLQAFVTKDGKQKNTKFVISERSMKIMCKLTIHQWGSVLHHFSKICRNRKTYLLNKTEEEDDPMFRMQNFKVHVTDTRLLETLNRCLYKELEQCMNGKKSHVFLSHPSWGKWTKAEKFDLLAHVNTVTVGKKRRNRKRIETWYEYPRLDAVMVSLRGNCSQDFKAEWLDDAIIKFSNVTAPLKKCIYSRFGTADTGTYIYNFGVWIEMKAQYLYFIETNFIEAMSSHLLEANGFRLLLPWKNPGPNKKSRKEKGEDIQKKAKEETCFKVKKFDMKKMKPKWKNHYETICLGDQFDKVWDKAKKLSERQINPSFNFNSLEKMSAQQKAAYLYRILECNLYEDDYNIAHTLLDMILPESSERRVITCDKKTPHGIELCDIMIFDESTTYLVHVKAKFEAGPIREVCSQIRNAADIVFREQTLSVKTGIIGKYWKMLTSGSNSRGRHDNEVKLCSESVNEKKFEQLFCSTRDIVFVLACRDTREGISFSQSKECDLEVSVKDEISKKFTKSDSSEIITNLTKEGYLTDEKTLTNKFILEGKGTKVSFKQNIRGWNFITSEKKAEDVFEALMSGLSRSKSTVAKMEIIRLVQHFKEYTVDNQQKFQLKILDIGKDFPD